MSEASDAIGNRVLEAATEAATRVLEGRMVSAYALGSLAHGGYLPSVSDIDVAFVVEDPVLPSDPAAMEAVKKSVISLGLPQADLLSVFWGSRQTLSGTQPGGRFPPLDRLDLLLHGRLLAGREAREGLPAPDRKDLVTGAAEFALQVMRKPEEVQYILDPSKLAKRGIRYLTKRVLFPVRFLYTARTGQIGRVDAAVDHYIRQKTPCVSLVTEALRWRVEPPEEERALRLLSLHVLPLYLEFLDDHVQRMEEYGEMNLAAQLRAWRSDLSGTQHP